jgi:hypothetical protein
VHVERRGKHFAGIGTGRGAVTDVARHGLVEEDGEVNIGGVDDLNVMRVGARDEVDVAFFEVVGVQRAVRIHHGHPPGPLVHVSHLCGDRMPMRFPHTVFADPQRVHRKILQRRPVLSPRQPRRSDGDADHRVLGLHPELVWVVGIGGRRNDRICLAGGKPAIVGVPSYLGEVARWQVVGVAEHGIGHRTERRRKPEVLGAFVPEREDELSELLADVLDVMH